MEPVVAHPPVDHRALRRSDLQRRVRPEQGHDDREAFIAAAQHPDLAVGLRQVGLVHQPVDRVIGVGRVIDLGRVERPDRRAGDDVGAFRPIFAADVLEHPDVAILDE